MSVVATVAFAIAMTLAPPSPASPTSGVITPKSTIITFLTTTMTMKFGGISFTCATFDISGATNAAGTKIVADATSPAAQVTFSGCKAIGGLVTLTIAAHGSWEKQGGNGLAGDTWNVDFTIGAGASATNGAASVTFNTGCIATIATQTVSGSSMTDSDTNFEVTDNTLAYTTNGVGLGCPASGNGNITASGTAAFVTTPAISIS